MQHYIFGRCIQLLDYMNPLILCCLYHIKGKFKNRYMVIANNNQVFFLCAYEN